MMTGLCISVAFLLLASLPTINAFALVFPTTKDLAPRALLATPSGEIERSFSASSQFTFCTYIFLKKVPDQTEIALVSYSSEDKGENNELLVEAVYKEDKKYTSLYINGKGMAFQGAPPRNKWVHLCVTWSNKRGTSEMYIDGERKYKLTGLKKDYVIGQNGYFILGTDQDYYNDYFEPGAGIQGRQTAFNLWDKVLTSAEVNQSRNCSLNGNVLNWHTTKWLLQDGISVDTSSSPCGACNEDGESNAGTA